MTAAYWNEVRSILMAHGAGGGMTQRLIEDLLLPRVSPDRKPVLDDAARLDIGSTSLAFTTDSFVVQPLFFPGGNIGSLAVSGTVNDLLMMGAVPEALSLALIIEEGFPTRDLEQVAASLGETAKSVPVSVVTGDTKVVGKGEADGVYINTSGIGRMLDNVSLSGGNARVGDRILVSGDIGAHGIAVMTARNELEIGTGVVSDAAPLVSSVLPLLDTCPTAVHVLRDPTRGGVAMSLNEIAVASKVTVEIDESGVPVAKATRTVADLLGLDPLYLPCEGRFVAFVAPESVDTALGIIEKAGNGIKPSVIGEVTAKSDGEVHLMTRVGGRRFLAVPSGELLPRIC